MNRTEQIRLAALQLRTYLHTAKRELWEIALLRCRTLGVCVAGEKVDAVTLLRRLRKL